jgi:hypothetical protein
VTIVAASVDSLEDTSKVADPLGFPVAYGVTREQGDAIGAWWDERRNHIQPSEFLLTKSGKVMMSTYSNSPIGRMDPAEAITLMGYLNAQHAKKEAN